jgi:hypothetical protein
MLKHIKIADVGTKQLVINGQKRGALTHVLEAKIMGNDCVELTAFNQPMSVKGDGKRHFPNFQIR